MFQPIKIASLALALISCIACAERPQPQRALPDDHALVYKQIRTNLEQHLFQLPPRVQGHYGIRLYRMTGDPQYANAALVDLLAVAEAQSYYACRLEDPDFIRREAAAAIAALGNDPRGIARRQALAPFPEFIFYTEFLLRFASRTQALGFTGPCHDKLLSALKRTDLTRGLTDKTMIRAWAAQLVNYAYWAKQLGVGDYLADYKKAFIATYPNDRDAHLSQAQFRNKLYGMTHFIFAASEYYQHTVDAKEFSWILDYFSGNIARILRDATEDIIAEVGISFLLAERYDSETVTQTRNFIAKAFEPGSQMIPSPTGDTDLAKGEHRNVLAMMLLNWPQRLHPGPYLSELPATNTHLPKQVTPLETAH